MFKYLRELLEELLSKPDYNSRFIYLIGGLVSCLCVFILSMAFICATNRDSFVELIAVLLGGGLGIGGIGRYLTKKATTPTGGSESTTEVTKEITKEVTKENS